MTTAAVPREIVLPGGNRVAEVAAATKHALAIDVSGKMFAWGQNDHAQLGDGTTVNRIVPTAVNASSDLRFSKPVLQDLTTTVQTSSGHVFTWGDDFDHFLASGRRSIARTPIAEPDTFLSPVVDVATGQGFTLALLANGDVYARGFNGGGQFANGDPNGQPSGKWIKTALRDLVSIAASTHGMALDRQGRIVTWGPYGVAGAPVTPTFISLPDNAVAQTLVPGDHFSAVLSTDGRVYTWGTNLGGTLGLGDQMDRDAPTRVSFPGEAPIASLACNGYCQAAAVDGRRFVWGSNSYLISYLPQELASDILYA